MQTIKPDGEYFVDVATNPIPNADTWDTLSINQLIEAKNELTNRFYTFESQPTIAKTLSVSIEKIDKLIEKRLKST